MNTKNLHLLRHWYLSVKKLSLGIAAVASLAVLSNGCSPALPAPLPFEPFVRNAASVDLDRAMSGAVTVEVTPIFTGEISVDRSLLLDLANPGLPEREDRKLWVPVMSYLVRHPKFGSVLLDCGFDVSAQSGHLNYGGLAVFFDITRQRAGGDLYSSLRTLGQSPDQLSLVILSHLHGDHISGMASMPPGVRVAAGPRALDEYEHLWFAPADHLGNVGRLETFDFASATNTELGPTIDLFGDGSMLVIHSEGHTLENLSFLLQAHGGPLLLTFDASHTQEGFVHGVAPGKVKDRVKADASLRRLIGFAKKHPNLRVKAGHDASDWDLTKSLQDRL